MLKRPQGRKCGPGVRIQALWWEGFYGPFPAQMRRAAIAFFSRQRKGSADSSGTRPRTGATIVKAQESTGAGESVGRIANYQADCGA